MKQFYLFTLLLFSLPMANLQSQAIDDGLYAMIFAENHQLLLRLHYDNAPMTVANFVGLAEGTISNEAFPKGRPFFDDSSFDRVVPGHVIQGGVPNSKISTSAGYTIPNEIHPELGHHKAGMLGMANAGPDTGNNVFYITLSEREYLDGDYTVFGEMLEPPPANLALNTRIDSIRIIRVGKEAEAYTVNDNILSELINQVQLANEESRLAREKFEAEYIQENYPTAEIAEEGWQFILEQKGKGKKVKKLKQVAIRFKAHTPQGLEFGSTELCTSYWIPAGEKPGVCNYILGKTSIVKGFDEAILEMKRGAKLTLILKPEQAYGNRGYYPPKGWGNQRFHISPKTTIIYEIEILN